MTKSYPVLARAYDKGLNTTSSAETLDPAFLTVAENCRFTQDGGCSTRAGFTLQSSTGSGAKCNSMHAMPEYSCMFAKSGTKIYQTNDGWLTSYTIGLTQTAGERTAFHAFRKDMFCTNQTDGFIRIATSTVASVNTGAATLTVRTGDGSQFAASGTFYVRGIAVTYTGLSTDTLTGCTGLTVAMAALDIITQTSSPANAPAGSCLTDFLGQLIVGGVAAKPDQVYCGAPATDNNPEFAYDFTANGASIKPMPQPVTALRSTADICLIGTKRGIHYGYDFSVDTGGFLTKSLTADHEVPNAVCFAQIENNTFAIFTGRRILLVVKDAYGVRLEDDPNQPGNNFDYNIRGELLALDSDQSLSFTHFDPNTRELFASVIKDGLSKIYVSNIDLRAWCIDSTKEFSCMANLGYLRYAGSDSDDSMFLDNDGTTDNTLPIRSRIVTPVYTNDGARITSDYLMFTFAGLLSAAGSFTLRIYVNGELSLTQAISAEDLQLAGYMSVTAGVPAGSGTIDAETIGTAGTQSPAYAFTYPFEFFLTGERFQAEFEIFDEGTVFELRNSRLDAETEGFLELTPS